jgi:hypothetical protein
MLLCSTCIEKIIPPYTYKKEQYVNHFCYDCNCETSHIEYEVFKNKLFDVISKNYRFLKDLPEEKVGSTMQMMKMEYIVFRLYRGDRF